MATLKPFLAGKGTTSGRLQNADGSYSFELGSSSNLVRDLQVGDYVELLSDTTTLDPASPGLKMVTWDILITPPKTLPAATSWLLSVFVDGVLAVTYPIIETAEPTQYAVNGGWLSNMLASNLKFKLEVV